MGSKELGKLRRWIREHGLVPERTCSECAWFSEKYPTGMCLKWDKEPDKPCQSFHMRRRAKKIVLIDKWCKDYSPSEKEDYGYILDFMPHKRLAYIVGEKYFTLLAVSIKKGKFPLPLDRVYIGKNGRDVVEKVKRKLKYDDLTELAKSWLPHAVNIIVRSNLNRFIEFFNNPFYISTHLHSFGLLALINENKLKKLIKEYQKRPFKDVLDLRMRTGIKLDDLIKSISNRALCELKGYTKYILFVNPSTIE